MLSSKASEFNVKSEMLYERLDWLGKGEYYNVLDKEEWILGYTFLS